jgi:hypothetical protein
MSLHCSPTDSNTSVLMRQVYVIPKSEKADTLSALKVLGVTRERLFSDISTAVDTFVEDIATRRQLMSKAHVEPDKRIGRL